MSATTLVTIDKDIPFSDALYWQLQGRHEQLEAVIRHSSQYERHYLAWEEVRKGRNPFFENGTGFEGYFVGVCSSSEEALQRILTINRELLENLSKLHRFETRFRSRLLKTLTGEVNNDYRAITEWSAEFGAVLARLRCNVRHNRQSDLFQAETYQLVQWLPSIQYSLKEHNIQEHYAVARVSDHSSKIIVTTAMLKPTDQEAWLVAQSIGKFGHPLVRELA